MPGHHYFKGQNFSVKSLSKNTIFYKKKMLVTDVITAKYIEEAQLLKLQPAWVKKIINFTPK